MIGGRRGLVLGVAFVAATTLGACRPVDDAAVTILAAASLRDAVERATEAYASDRPAARFVVATDSSAALRAQIEQGAPADLFLSADAVNPARLVDAGLTDGAPVAFASARLVVVVPAGNPAAIESPRDLARDGVRIIAAGPEVPITAYADRLVAALAELGGYPANFAARYERNVRSREDNARAVIAKIALGEGDAAIVYEPDAGASAGVKTVEVPDAASVAATYSGVVVLGGGSTGEAHAFLDWLVGPDGQAILDDLGFGPAAVLAP